MISIRRWLYLPNPTRYDSPLSLYSNLGHTLSASPDSPEKIHLLPGKRHKNSGKKEKWHVIFNLFVKIWAYNNGWCDRLLTWEGWGYRAQVFSLSHSLPVTSSPVKPTLHTQHVQLLIWYSNNFWKCGLRFFSARFNHYCVCMLWQTSQRKTCGMVIHYKHEKKILIMQL